MVFLNDYFNNDYSLLVLIELVSNVDLMYSKEFAYAKVKYLSEVVSSIQICHLIWKILYQLKSN
jgi:hypothetical protein